jgi:hypothetical protein
MPLLLQRSLAFPARLSGESVLSVSSSFVLALLVALGWSASGAQFTSPICGPDYMKGIPDSAPGQTESDVKAAVLFRCLELIQWPAGSAGVSQPIDSPGGAGVSPAATSPIPIKIGVLGKNPFGNSLDSFAKKTLSGRPLVVTNLARITQPLDCDLIFIGSSEKKQTAKILKKLDGLPILTVGETPGFTEAGGMICLLRDGKNLRLDVNAAAAQKAGLVLDPQLIKLTRPAS